MPLPSWNHIWTARDVAGHTHLEIIQRYCDALNERSAALDGPNYTPISFALGGVAMSVLPGAAGWGQVQAAVASLAGTCVRKTDGSGAYTPQAKYGIDSCAIGIDGSGTLSWLPFPWPNGWTRKFPREIWKLAYPGAAGQRARFITRLGSNWFGDLSTANPATTGFGTAVATPSGERSNSL